MARSQAGFTLLELIVALVVLGFLMVGLTEGSRFGFIAWKHQADVISDHDQFDAVDRTLRQLLTQVQMRAADSPGELSFNGTLPAAVALRTHRADMDLLVDRDHRLILQWTPKPHETSLGPPEPPTVTVLLRNVDHMDIDYWHDADTAAQPANGQAGDQGQAPAPDPTTQQVGWNNESNSTEAPKLIRLTLIFPPGDRRHWPPIVLAPASMGPGPQDATAAAQ